MLKYDAVLINYLVIVHITNVENVILFARLDFFLLLISGKYISDFNPDAGTDFVQNFVF